MVFRGEWDIDEIFFFQLLAFIQATFGLLLISAYAICQFLSLNFFNQILNIQGKKYTAKIRRLAGCYFL
jgi:hypothetical protein